MQNYEIILNLLDQLKECEPKLNSYMFKHTYDAAKEVYDNCIRIVNEALYTKGKQFYGERCFNHDQVLQDIESGKGLKPIGTNTTGLREEN